MTHKEVIQDEVKRNIDSLDVLYELYGRDHGTGAFIDTVFLIELWKDSDFLSTLVELVHAYKEG